MYLHDTINNFKITNLTKFTSSELYYALEILILYNKNTYCVTSIIFELCHREFQTMLDPNKIVCSENTNLKRLTKYIEHLSRQGRFLKDKFRTMCHELILEDQITLEILWWLDQNNLIYFEDYWATKPTSHIILQLKTFISSLGENIHTVEDQKQCIARNIFLKLLLGVNSQTSSLWCARSQNIFEKYLNDALEELIFNPNNAKLIGFIKAFRETDIFYGTLIKEICRNILRKLISCQEKVTIYDAIKKQEQWSTKNLDPNIIDLYFELVRRFILDELFELIKEVSEQNINWRFVLTFVAVFVHKTEDSYKQLKGMISHHLQSAFSESLSPGILVHSSSTTEVQVLSGVVVARTACLEQSDPGHEYSEWVAHTWGAHSVQRCGTNPEAWERLLGALQAALPHEPPWVLTVHVARALRAPPKHNHDMLIYKDQCRTRLECLGTTSKNNDNRDSASDLEDFCT